MILGGLPYISLCYGVGLPLHVIMYTTIVIACEKIYIESKLLGSYFINFA